MQIIVQKFGGTSVATAEARAQAVEHIIAAREEGYAPVVVVSAMGRNGDPYATDTLINMVRTIEKEVAPRELDLLTSCGEIISTVVMVQTLQGRGYDAVALTGGQAGIQTDDNFGNAQINQIKPQQILDFAGQGKVVVVAGFQGLAPDGSITTLGRGGSDTTATALGAALKAEVVEIYTDVDGVMTVDPRLVPEAKILNDLTYKEVCEMAYQGAKVIHPRAVEAAMSGEVPIKIKNTFSDAEGTLIAKSAAERAITGLAHLTNIAQIGVIVPDTMSKREAEVKVFRLLAQGGISLDMISVMPDGIYFTVTGDQGEKTASLLSEAGFQYKLTSGCAKLSVIGAGMQGLPGVMANLMEALYEAGVAVLQTSDSDITISFLVMEDDITKAVKILHETFKLG
ncbi:MAG: aspartate kinase [Clostridia bacterium]|nr:aspartate kinase [Clostridia bacterium]